MRLRTLGGLTLDGSDFRRPKPLLLLAFLALEGGRDRRHLSELFWPDAREPMTSLRMALSQLRRSVPGALATTGDRVEARIPCDAVELSRALDEGSFEEAAARYEGAFLDGFYLRECGPELEEWIYATREFLAARVREGLLRTAEGEARGGAFAAAAVRAEAAARLPGAADPDPGDLERLYTLLIAGESLSAADVQAAGEAYGLELSTTTDEARERLRGRPAPNEGPVPAEAPHRLPAPTSPFVGRDPELLELSRLLSDPAVRVVTITGVGGVGKSRLAVEAAQGEVRAGTFPDGVYFVPLESLTDPGLVPATIADVLGVVLPGRSDPATELAEALKGRTALVVLDNLEHLMGAASLVGDLVRASPRLKVLATSRARLDLAAEHLFALEGFPRPEVTPSLEEARYLDAVRFFVNRAQRVHPGFALTESVLPHVLRICRSLDGVPLAIELAAAWTRVMDVGDIADETERNLDVVATSERDVRRRHRSLRDTFEYSWNLLGEGERAALRRLSVFVGGFSREAAAAVADVSIPRLAALLDQSLLRTLDHGRYDRHPLLYGYTLEKLAEDPAEEEEARSRHAAWFLALAREADAHHRGPDQVEWLDRLDREQGNLRAALEWSLSGGDPSAGLALTASLHSFWYHRSRFLEGEGWLDRALEVADGGRDAALRARLLSAAGILANERGEDARAARMFEERLELARASGDLEGQASSLNSLGVVAWGRRDHDRAERYLSESLALRRALGRPPSVAVSLNNLGLVTLARGDHARAREQFAESLSICRESGDAMGVAMTLSNLGTTALEAHDFAEAERLLNEAATRYHELGDRAALAGCLAAFAALAVERGRPEDAARLAGAADALRSELGAAPRDEERERFERWLAPAREALGAAGYEEARRAGRTLDLEGALILARALPADADHRHRSGDRTRPGDEGRR